MPEDELNLDSSEITDDAPQTDASDVAETSVTPDDTDDGSSDNPEWDDKTRSYVEKLRQESAGYRTERNAFRDAFEGFEDDEVSAFLSAVKAIPNDPAAAHEAFSGLAAALAEAAGITAEQAEDIVTDLKEEGDEDQPLTRKELDKYLADQKEAETKAESEKKALEALDQEIESLGYKKGSSDESEALNYVMLLHFAAEKTGGDLAEADQKVKAYRQSVIDSFLESEKAAGDSTPPQAEGGAGTPVSSKPKSIKEAAKAAKAKLDAQFGTDSDGAE